MTKYKLKKTEFNNFVNEVMQSYGFIAPVKEDPTNFNSESRFEEIPSPEKISRISIEKITTCFPAKHFFFDKKETIFEFDGNKIINPTIELRERVIFGLRRCDLNGIKHQDTVFIDENEDPFYKTRRESTLLIGLQCKEGDEYCFCNSLKLEECQDLMFFDKGEHYLIESGSEKGEKFAKKINLLEESDEKITEEDRKIENTKTLKSTDIKDAYHNEKWNELSKECLSCGACNHLCPNCHCFELKDEINFDCRTGKRVRVPAACQLKGFTRVAGDHVFRETRESRFKHRIYHQIEYFKDRHGVVFCTGCGRCIRGCPAKIDWVNAINDIKKK